MYCTVSVFASAGAFGGGSRWNEPAARSTTSPPGPFCGAGWPAGGVADGEAEGVEDGLGAGDPDGRGAGDGEAPGEGDPDGRGAGEPDGDGFGDGLVEGAGEGLPTEAPLARVASSLAMLDERPFPPPQPVSGIVSAIRGRRTKGYDRRRSAPDLPQKRAGERAIIAFYLSKPGIVWSFFNRLLSVRSSVHPKGEK